jgi:hypothetical protein
VKAKTEQGRNKRQLKHRLGQSAKAIGVRAELRKKKSTRNSGNEVCRLGYGAINPLVKVWRK